MSATRTQIYLTTQQRRRIDVIAVRDGVSMADVIRSAVDQYLEGSASDPTAALRATFGADRDVAVPPRDEWDRG